MSQLVDVGRGPEWIHDDDVQWPDAPHPAGDGAGTTRRSTTDDLDRIVSLLGSVDRTIATVLRLIRAHRDHPGRGLTNGLPLDQFLSLATGRTGADIRRILRAERALRAMPALDRAFAEGRITWPQVRATLGACRDLSRRQMGELDRELAEEIDHDDPDRLARRARDWAQVILEVDAVDTPPDPAVKARLTVEVDHLGGATLTVYDRVDSIMTIREAAEAAADAPVKAEETRVDADGQEVPAELLPSTARQAQLAEGLRRAAAAYLAGGADAGGTTRPARPAVSVVIDTTAAAGPIGKLLARWHGGPVPLTPFTTERILCDPQLSTVVVDGSRPVAIGDAESPISTTHYRALRAVDRGCRMPGCHAPAQHTDAHHVVHREDGGETSIDNLLLLCRSCHTTIHRHNIAIRLDRHTRAVSITLADGRTFTSHPD